MTGPPPRLRVQSDEASRTLSLYFRDEETWRSWHNLMEEIKRASDRGAPRIDADIAVPLRGQMEIVSIVRAGEGSP